MKSLSIVIPVYNEAHRIHLAFDALTTLHKTGWFDPLEVIFVDDGSVDASKKYIDSFAPTFSKRCISYSRHQGKGFAIQTGVQKANHDYVLTADADMATPLLEIKKFIPAMEMGTDILFGTRRDKNSTILRPQPIHRMILGSLYTWVGNTITGLAISDYSCGFKCYSRTASEKVFKHLSQNGWASDIEIANTAKKLGLPILEIPVIWQHIGESHFAIWSDGLSTIKDFWSLWNQQNSQ